MKVRLSIFIIILCSIFGLPCIAQAGEGSAAATVGHIDRFIQTQGTATMEIIPDEVVITMGVKTFNAALKVSQAENNIRTKEVVALAKKYGVESMDVQTSSMTVSQVIKGASEKVVGYEVRRTIIFDVKDLSKVEDLLSDAVKNGATSIDGQEFKTTQLRKSRDKIRVDAAIAAREKANLLAGALGTKVGKVRTIREDSYQDSWHSSTLSNSRILSNVFISNASSRDVNTSESEAGGSTFAVGKITVQCIVSITCDLE